MLPGRAANAIVNFRLAGDEVDYAVNDAGSRVLLVGSELMPLVDKLRERLPKVERVVEVTPDGAAGDEYEALLAAASPVDRSPDVSPDDVVLVMYSSGTTGHPKGVMLTQANMLAHTVNAHDGWVFEDGDINLVAMPLFHVGGSSYVLFGVHDGIPSIMTRDADGPSLAGAIMAGANRTFLVPAVLAQVLQSGEQGVQLFGKLRTYTYGASPMPLPLLRAAMDAWPDTDFIQVYGLTEVGGVATHLMPDAHPRGVVGAPRAAGLRGAPDPRDGAADRRPGHAGGPARRGARRDLAAQAPADEGVPRQAGGDGAGGPPRRLVPHRRHGQGRRRGVRVRRGPDQGHDHQRRREHLLPRDRAGAGRAPAVMEVAVIGVPDDRWGETVKAVVALKPDESASERS